MREEGFNTLAVIKTTTNAAAIRSANHHRHRPLLIGAIIKTSYFGLNLVKGRENKIGKLDFANWACIGNRRTKPNRNNREFRKRRVNNTLWAVFIKQAQRSAENTPTRPNILACNENTLITREFFIHRFCEGLNQCFSFYLYC